MIIARSPLRISLGGGGTDLPSYYREHGGFLIAAAIDKVDIHIGHFADNDMCKALVLDTLQIDLSALKSKYLEIWEMDNGLLGLNVTGWDEPIYYEF